MRVLLADGAMPGSLAITRSLGKRGIEVTSFDAMRWSTASLSRYCTHSLKCPSPEKDVSAFLKWLHGVVTSGRHDVLLPFAEVSNLLISMHKADLAKRILVGAPDYELLEKTHDKEKTLRIAQDVHLDVPDTHIIRDLREIGALKDKLEYPVVVKPRSKVSVRDGRVEIAKVLPGNYVHSGDELLAKYERVHSVSPFPLIQECIKGVGYGVSALMDKGEPKAVFMHKRLREYPITGGASTLRVSCYDEELKEQGLRMLRALNWQGVAMVEFKRDERDNRYKLIEVNGRWWGSLQLAVLSGVDFPHLYLRVLGGETVAPLYAYKVGVKCRSLIPFDFLWLVSAMRNGPQRLRRVREFLSTREIRDDVISAEDPLPVIGAIRVAAYYALRRSQAGLR